jgi:hypothetical protein
MHANLTGCDTMTALAAVTAHGQTLFANNSDLPANGCQPLVQSTRCAGTRRRSHPPGATVPCQFVSLPQVRETLRHVGSRPITHAVGTRCWGYEAPAARVPGSTSARW